MLAPLFVRSRPSGGPSTGMKWTAAAEGQPIRVTPKGRHVLAVVAAEMLPRAEAVILHGAAVSTQSSPTIDVTVEKIVQNSLTQGTTSDFLAPQPTAAAEAAAAAAAAAVSCPSRSARVGCFVHLKVRGQGKFSLQITLTTDSGEQVIVRTVSLVAGNSGSFARKRARTNSSSDALLPVEVKTVANSHHAAELNLCESSPPVVNEWPLEGVSSASTAVDLWPELEPMMRDFDEEVMSVYDSGMLSDAALSDFQVAGGLDVPTFSGEAVDGDASPASVPPHSVSEPPDSHAVADFSRDSAARSASSTVASVASSPPPPAPVIDAIVAGNLRVAGTVAARHFVETSDARLKRDIKNFAGALEVVCALQGRTYNWRADDHHSHAASKARVIGLIAQEVQAVLPEAVSTDAQTGVMGVSYTMLVPVLVEALKSLLAKHKQLEADFEEMAKEVGGNGLRYDTAKLETIAALLKKKMSELGSDRYFVGDNRGDEDLDRSSIADHSSRSTSSHSSYAYDQPPAGVSLTVSSSARSSTQFTGDVAKPQKQKYRHVCFWAIACFIILALIGALTLVVLLLAEPQHSAFPSSPLPGPGPGPAPAPVPATTTGTNSGPPVPPTSDGPPIPPAGPPT